MVTPEARKAHIETLIKMNPTEINITRQIRTEYAGAWTTDEVNVPSQTVRIFQQAPPIPGDIIKGVAGERYTYEMFMLASAEVDIRADSETEDRFVFNGAEYLVEVVRPQVLQGVLCGYQISLTRV